MGEPRELLPNPNPPTPEPAPAPPRAKRIVCDYCKCHLAADGTVLEGSDRVREIHTHEHTIETLRRDAVALNETIAALTTERDQALQTVRSLEADRDGRKRSSPFSR